MNISIEEKKKEALCRMRLLGIFPETIRQFEEDGYVSVSEPPLGAFYWLEGEDLERVRNFEDRHNALVYMVVRSYTNFGKMDCFLFVGDFREEWDMDMSSLADGSAFVYVYNYDAPDCSEFGYVGLARTVAAGLRRVW